MSPQHIQTLARTAPFHCSTCRQGKAHRKRWLHRPQSTILVHNLQKEQQDHSYCSAFQPDKACTATCSHHRQRTSLHCKCLTAAQAQLNNNTCPRDIARKMIPWRPRQKKNRRHRCQRGQTVQSHCSAFQQDKSRKTMTPIAIGTGLVHTACMRRHQHERCTYQRRIQSRPSFHLSHKTFRPNTQRTQLGRCGFETALQGMACMSSLRSSD